MTPQEIAQVLAQPIKINKLTLKNRVVMAPMAATSPDKEGRPTDQTVAFFEARARGGAGLIIMGGTNTSARGFEESSIRGAIRADRDDYIPDFRKIADAVHAHGVPIIAELTPSMGRMGLPGPGRDVIAASPKNVVMRGSAMGMPIPGGERATPMPREATIAEIEEMERSVIDAAVRFQKAGWDGVEIPSIMSYFLASFVSPRTNWRTDQYGGSLENRARVLVNIVKGVRAQCGPDFVVGLRITANDYMEDGQGAEGFAAVALEVEKAGIDYVALVYGCYEALGHSRPDRDGANLIETGDARVFKRQLSVPVMLSSLHDPANAAQAIADGHGDLVMEARQMLADPEYGRKATEGRANEIVRCDRENLCTRRMVLGMPVRCSVNPRMGLESRKPGAPPPLGRALKTPVEQVMLKLTQEKWFMEMVGVMTKAGSKADSSAK